MSIYFNLCFVLMITGVAVAFIMETIKKACGKTEIKDDKTYISCNVKPWILRALAVFLSLIGGLIVHYSGVSIGSIYIAPVYAILIYIAQLYIDMALIKKLYNMILEKILNKI